jgi:hypothetical protein
MTNPTGMLTNSDLKMAGVLLHVAVLEAAIHSPSNNDSSNGYQL